jgi:hypothetical protein
MRYIRGRFSQMKTWQQRLVIVFVILVVIALAGSLIAEQLYLRQRNGSETFQLRRGWTQVATYNGTGTKTIMNLHLDLPHLWGFALTCEGKDVTGKIDGTNSAGAPVSNEIGISLCSASSSNVAPHSIYLDLYTLHIQTIRLTASGTTTWHLQLAEVVNQPAIPSETEWASNMGIGGNVEANESSKSESTNLLPLRGPDGRTIIPRTYEIAFVCFGSGTGTVNLTPARGVINALNCDGHVRYVVIHYPGATHVESVQVSLTSAIKDTAWYMTLLGCVNEQRCANQPATIAPTTR